MNKQRAILAEHLRKNASQAEQLRGYTCPHCGQLGQHFQEKCPIKPFIGIPEVQRKAMQEVAILEAAGPSTFDYNTPPGFISGLELQCILRTRLDVPSFLRCAVCCQLVADAVWCSTCDAVSCSACLAPPDEAWVCPGCRSCCEDNFHVVTAVRDIAAAWLKGMALEVDAKLGLRPPQ